MKKRLFIFLFILVLAVSCLVVSCDKNKHTHTFGEWETTVEPTCTTAGSKVRKCSCGEEETASIAALGHKYGEWEITKEATTTEEGSKERVCSVCGNKETAKIEKVKEEEPAASKTDGITEVSLNTKLGSNKHATTSEIEVLQNGTKVEISGVVEEASALTNSLHLAFAYDNDNQKSAKNMFVPAHEVDTNGDGTADAISGAYYKVGTTKTWLAAKGVSSWNAVSDTTAIAGVLADEYRGKNGELVQKAAFVFSIANLRAESSTSKEIVINWTGAKDGEKTYTIDWSKAEIHGHDKVTAVTGLSNLFTTATKTDGGAGAIGYATAKDTGVNEYGIHATTQVLEKNEGNDSTNGNFTVEQIGNRVILHADGSALVRTTGAIYDATKAKKSTAATPAWDKKATYGKKLLDAGYIIGLQFAPVNTTSYDYKPTVTVSDTENAYVDNASAVAVKVYWRIDELNEKTLDVTIKWSNVDNARTYTISTDDVEYAEYTDEGVKAMSGTTINGIKPATPHVQGNQVVSTGALDDSVIEVHGSKVVVKGGAGVNGEIQYLSADTKTGKANAGYYTAVEYLQDLEFYFAGAASGSPVSYSVWAHTVDSKGNDKYAKATISSEVGDGSAFSEGLFHTIGSSEATTDYISGANVGDIFLAQDIAIKLDGKDVVVLKCKNSDGKFCEKLGGSYITFSSNTLTIKLSNAETYNLSENATPSTSICWNPTVKDAKTYTYNVSVDADATYDQHTADDTLFAAGKLNLVDATKGTVTPTAFADTVETHYYGYRIELDKDSSFDDAVVDYDSYSIVKTGVADATRTDAAEKGKYYKVAETAKKDTIIRGAGNYAYVEVTVDTDLAIAKSKINYSVDGEARSATLSDPGIFIAEIKLTSDNQEVKFVIEYNKDRVQSREYTLVFGELEEKTPAEVPALFKNGVSAASKTVSTTATGATGGPTAGTTGNMWCVSATTGTLDGTASQSLQVGTAYYFDGTDYFTLA